MASSRKMKAVLLASEWGSKLGGLSTFNRELAIQLAKHPDVQVSVFLPKCDQEGKIVALNNNVTLVDNWTYMPAKDKQIDFVIGQGVSLGRKAQLIQKEHNCKWVQFLHTDPEELAMIKDHSDAITRIENEHREELDLCVMADLVVAVGPKLAGAYQSYLYSCEKDQNVFVLTPGIFSEISRIVHRKQDGGKCRVLALSRRDAEDVTLKGYNIAAKAVAKLNDDHIIFISAPDKKKDEVVDRLQVEYKIPRERLKVRSFQKLRDKLQKQREEVNIAITSSPTQGFKLVPLEDREQMKQQFSEADLAVMPSRTEDFGLVALEAMSAGLPVLVSANSGFGEALENVSFGSPRVIKSEDSSVWAEQIESVWAKERKVRLNEYEAARDSSAETYSWEDQCRNLVKEMRSILRNSGDHSIHDRERSATKRKRSSQGVGDHSIHDTERTEPKKKKSSQGGRTRSTAEHDSSSLTKTVKPGCPWGDVLGDISRLIGPDWKHLARKLGFHRAEITDYESQRSKHREMAFEMLLDWRQREGSSATFEVLDGALRHKSVRRRDLAEEFCCDQVEP